MPVLNMAGEKVVCVQRQSLTPLYWPEGGGCEVLVAMLVVAVSFRRALVGRGVVKKFPEMGNVLLVLDLTHVPAI